jgi:hypothetical protein
MDLTVYGKKPVYRRPAELESERVTPAAEKPRLALTPSASALFAKLRQPLRLSSLEHYPHVLNRIAELWSRPQDLDEYFRELSIDDRRDRQGFPLEVIAELSRVQNFYQKRVTPAHRQTDVWASMHLR